MNHYRVVFPLVEKSWMMLEILLGVGKFTKEFLIIFLDTSSFVKVKVTGQSGLGRKGFSSVIKEQKVGFYCIKEAEVWLVGWLRVKVIVHLPVKNIDKSGNGKNADDTI